MAVRFAAQTLFLVAALLVPASGVLGQPAKGFNELGVMAFEAKRYELALEHFEKALALAPGNPSIRSNLCAVHQAIANDLANEGKLEEAIERLQLGVAADPGNPLPLAQLGAYYLKLGKLSEAVANLEAAVKLDPAGNDARLLLGEAYYQQNKLAEAREQWEKVMAVKPEWPGLREKLEKLSRESQVEQDFSQYESGHFQISYAKALSEETRAVVFAALEEAYAGVGAKLGDIFPPTPVQVVLYDSEQFSEATQSPAHVGALYDGKIRAPITGRNGRFLDKRVLGVRLSHEFVHVALVNHLGPRLPWWLNEGLAEVFSREMDQTRKRALRRALAGDQAFSLAALEDRQLEKLEPEALGNAYAIAHATAEHLWRTGGTEKLSAFIRGLKDGLAPEAALNKAYGLDYATLERDVKAAYP